MTKKLSFGSALSAAFALASQAQAQTLPLPYNAGDALRESEAARREAPRAPRPQVEIPQFAEPRLTIQENEKLFVRRFDIDAPSGLIPPEETQDVLAPFENRKLTLNEIYDAADQVTNLYRSHGYFVAKAYVPAQDARSGALRIKLIIGRYAAISLQNNSLVDSGFLQGVLNRALDGSPYIHKDELERAMLLMSDLPGAGTPRIAISSGKEPETSDVNFTAREAPRTEGYILGDNYGSPYTGRLRMSGSLAVNSPLGVSDRLSVFGILSEQAELANWRVAYGFPLGLDGLRGELSAFQTTYVLGGLYKASEAAGVANGISANLSYPVKRQRDDSVYLFSTFTHKYLDDRILGASTASRTIDLGTVGVTRNTFGALLDMPLVTETTLSGTIGDVNFPNPEDRAANVAGVDTTGVYARFNLNFNATLAINSWSSLSATLRAQKSSGRNLDASEKLGLTGYFGVRSYDEGLAGDSGYIFTPELKFALPDVERYRHSVGLFTDVGAAWLEHGAYTTTQATYTPLSDVGLGYYGAYQFAPAESVFVKAQVAHSYGSESVAPAYDRHTKGLVQIGLSAASDPTHGGIFSEAPAPDFGASLAALLPEALNAPESPPPSPSSPPPPQAPLGVFGADMPARGLLVLSAIPYFANFSHSQIGAKYISPQNVVANYGWYYNPTLNLRTVPIDMAVAQQSLTLAYGLTDSISLVLGTGFTEKHSHMMTFFGGAIPNPPFWNLFPRGMSFPAVDSITDTTLAGIWRFYEDPIHRLQLNVGLSFPTGSAHEPGTLLQPNGTYQIARDFYGMESGTGTFDIMPGLVYRGGLDQWSWGLSYRARLPLAVNPEGYAWGDLHEFGAWGGYSWIPGLTTTLRLAGTLQGSIIGHDPQVVGKVQTADPNDYGGQRVEIFAGATINGALFGASAFDIAMEGGVPVYQNLNGPQLARNWQANMALRYKVGKEDRSKLPLGLGALLPSYETSPEMEPNAPLWTGLRVGVNFGANFGGNDKLETVPGPTLSSLSPGALPATGLLALVSNSSLTFRNEGFLGGAQVGYDWRLSQSVVAGFEAGIDGVAGSAGVASQLVGATSGLFSAIAKTNGYKTLDYVGTVRARLGYLATPRLLLYGSGGFAMAGVNLNTGVFVQETIAGFPYPVSGTSLYQDLRPGWAAGVGLEWMFAPHWSLKAEYLYYNTGTAHPVGGVALIPSTPALAAFTAPQPGYMFDGNIARLGLNYHFNGRAPVASAPVEPAPFVPLLTDAAATTPAPAIAPPPGALWTGLYGGLNLGAGWSSGSGETGYLPYLDPSFPLGSVMNGITNLWFLPSGAETGGRSGLIAGGQIGYDYQLLTHFLIGVEADLQGSNITSGNRGDNTLYASPYGIVLLTDPNTGNLYPTTGTLTPLGGGTGGVSWPWLSTARVRAGILPLSTLLVYGTGGLTYAHVTTYTSGGLHAGWNAGGGVEWMLAPGWSAKAEFLHVDLGDDGVANPFLGTSGDHIHPRLSVARAGLNYHFNWGSSAPVEAKY